MHMASLQISTGSLKIHLVPLRIQAVSLQIHALDLQMQVASLQSHSAPFKILGTASQIHTGFLQIHTGSLEILTATFQIGRAALQIHIASLQSHAGFLQIRARASQTHLASLRVHAARFRVTPARLEIRVASLQIHAAPLQTGRAVGEAIVSSKSLGKTIWPSTAPRATPNPSGIPLFFRENPLFLGVLDGSRRSCSTEKGQEGGLQARITPKRFSPPPLWPIWGIFSPKSAQSGGQGVMGSANVSPLPRFCFLRGKKPKQKKGLVSHLKCFIEVDFPCRTARPRRHQKPQKSAQIHSKTHRVFPLGASWCPP